MLIEYVTLGQVETGSIEEFRSKHPGASIQSIDGKDYVSYCESCSALLVSGDSAYVYEDGVHTCQTCGGEPGQAMRVL